MSMPVEGITWGSLAMKLFGGLALFLMGMELLAESLRTVAGERMRAILGRLTTNRLLGVLTGAFVTAVIQSSSVTTVLVVGFVSAGLMSMSQSVGIIMGANIGTTVTAQIIAFKVTKYALLLVAVGFLVQFVGSRRWRHHGTAILGLGLVFFGMAIMGEAMVPLRTHPPFLELLARLSSPLYGILAGAAFTALIQSSSATTGIVIVMAGQGLISLSAGIALALGANVGTCVTALLATIGRPREALRAALVHVVFNMGGVLLWVGLIDQLARVVVVLSPEAVGLSGVERLAAETPRQIANAHTLFNIVNTIVFIGFAGPLARFVEWLAPDRPEAVERAVRARYLDLDLLPTPSLALDRARLELLGMGERVRDMVVDILPAALAGSADELEAIAERDQEVDALHGKIVAYLGQISREELTDRNTSELLKLLQASNALENIGDVVETNMVALGQRRIAERVNVSAATRKVMEEFHRQVSGGPGCEPARHHAEERRSGPAGGRHETGDQPHGRGCNQPPGRPPGGRRAQPAGCLQGGDRPGGEPEAHLLLLQAHGPHCGAGRRVLRRPTRPAIKEQGRRSGA